MTRNHISTHLLRFADEDDFRSVLHILLTAGKNVNFNAKTKYGDYLITLLAYATCEQGSGVQLYALKCLKWVLDRDFTAVNKVAQDGGSVLHCSLAAASCLDDTHDEHSVCSNDDSDEDSEEDYDDDSEGDIGDSACADKEFIQEIVREATNNSSLDEYCKQYGSLTNGEITVTAIYLLLSNEADVNLPLGNVHGLCQFEDENDEIDLTYSREATIQQWTPLMFAAQWVLLACSRYSNNTSELCIPLLVMILLLNNGADPSYMMANEDDWNMMQVLSSANHILARINVSAKAIVEEINTMRTKLGLRLVKGGKMQTLQNDDRMLSFSKFLETILTATDASCSCMMSPVQEFASAILANDAVSAELTLNKESDCLNINEADLLRKWRTASFDEVLPTLETVWNNSGLSGKTIFDVACSCLARDSVKFMVGKSLLQEHEIRHGIICTFEDLGGRSDLDKKDYHATGRLIEHQMEIIKAILENEHNEKIPRQKILDRLLLESCTSKMWTLYSPYATSMLVQLGADPNVTSISDEVYDALTPLHLVAGNCRGQGGTEKIVCLLLDHDEKTGNDTARFQRANLFAVTSSSHQMPINIALEKRNWLVVGKLLEAMGEEHIKRIDWTLDEAILIAKSAIATVSAALFEQAIDLIIASSSGGGTLDCRSSEKSIGGLLLTSIDRRSGLGIDSSDRSSLTHFISVITTVQLHFNLKNLASWARDEISGHNCLHLILRNDRGIEFRRKVLESVCEIFSQDTNGCELLSQPCARAFGGFTPLHLACALGCEYSIKTLIRFGASATVLDGDEKLPKALIPEHVKISEEIWVLSSKESTLEVL